MDTVGWGDLVSAPQAVTLEHMYPPHGPGSCGASGRFITPPIPIHNSFTSLWHTVAKSRQGRTARRAIALGRTGLREPVLKYPLHILLPWYSKEVDP
jgi:hypothetical protein